MVAEIEKEGKNIDNKLFKNCINNCQSPRDMYKNLRKTEGKKNEDQVYAIKKVLDRIKKAPENKKSKIEKNEKVINIVDNILYFNQLEQQKGEGLKILTPNQMHSSLPITLAQLNAGNNSELTNEIRKLLHYLYRSKKLTKQLSKSLIDII